jgi:hypothetical protein
VSKIAIGKRCPVWDSGPTRSNGDLVDHRRPKVERSPPDLGCARLLVVLSGV